MQSLPNWLPLLLPLAVITMALWAFYFWWKKDRHTRERFAFTGFLALLGFATFYGQSLLGNVSILDRLLRLLPMLLGTTPAPTPSPLTPMEAVLLGLVLAGLGYVYLQIFKHWNGLKSIAHYEQEQHNEAPSVWLDIRLLLSPSQRERLAAQQETLPKSESLTWHERARQLWLLRNRSYQFTGEYDPARQCWLGGEKHTEVLVLLICVHEKPANEVLHALATYAQQVAKNQRRSEIELIVALKSMTLIVPKKTCKNYCLQYTSEGLLLHDLVDFSAYFLELRARVEREKLVESQLTLADTYTPSHYRLEKNGPTQEHSLETYLCDWLQDTTQRQIALLGEYGQGKSTTALLLSYHLQAETASRIPILIKLQGKSLRNVSPEELLATWAYHYHIDTQALLHLHSAGRLLLIFDGFDEMDDNESLEARIDHFYALWHLNYGQAKIIITGRPSFFLGSSKLKQVLGKVKQIQLIYLAPFTLAKISEALRAESTLTQTGIIDLAAQDEKFLEIVSQPALLYWVTRLWDTFSAQQSISPLPIIDALLRKVLLQRERHYTKNHCMALNNAERHYFMAGIAAYMAIKHLPNQIEQHALAKVIQILVDIIPDAVSKSADTIDDKMKQPLRSEARFEWKNKRTEALRVIETDLRSSGLLAMATSHDGLFSFSYKIFMEILQAQVFLKIQALDEAAKHNKHAMIQPIHRLDNSSTPVSTLAAQLKPQLHQRTLHSTLMAKALWLPESNVALPTGWNQGQITLTQLKVKNYRGFKQAEWSLSPQFTLLIGDNGTGKTAILNALAIIIRTMFVAFRSDIDIKFGIAETDIRLCTYHKTDQITWEPQYPLILEVNAIIGKQPLTWNLTQQTPSDIPAQSGYQSMVDISKALQQAVQYGENVTLPVVAYYPCGRLWQGAFSESIDTVPPDSRFAGYNHCLHICAEERELFAWWKTQTISALQNKQPSQLLHIVKEAVCACLLDWVDISYQVQRDELMVSNADGHTLAFHMLSDGVRNILVLVADIAHRAAILNPHLGDAVLQQTPGFVLIDEIDLHLHPKWQRRMIEDLRRVFPKVQFIATTHSPFMIQSLQSGELVDLNELPLEPYSDRSIEDITETVMGVKMPQKSERYQKMMEATKRYYALLEQATNADQHDIETLKAKLDELLIPYNNNPAFTAYLTLQREKKLHEGESNATR